MNLQNQTVSYILQNPASSIADIMGATSCGRSVAYAALSAVDRVKEINTGRTIGAFSCLHQPATTPGYLEFVKRTFKRFNVDEVVNLGDLIDHHFISRHVSEPDALNPLEEMDLAILKLKDWVNAFPDVKWCKGNHDAIPVRQVKTLGIPSRFLKSLNEIYELPATWEMKSHWEIDGVWYEHGIGSNGMYGAKNTAMRYRQSYVQGHTHAHAGIHHLFSPKDNIFGMNVGCGMDEKSYASRYGKIFKDKICLGCGIVIDGKIPFFVPMEKPLPSQHG